MNEQNELESASNNSEQSTQDLSAAPQTAVKDQNQNIVLQSAKALESIKNEIAKAFVGQEEVVDQVLVTLIAGGHILLEGVPGLGKTLLVRALASCFGGEFSRVQFTPDLMPTDVTGHALYNMASQTFETRKGPVFTNLLLADEINRAPAKTQAALLEVMQEKQVTIEGESFNVPLPFMVLATQNPVEQEGTYPLPEAELDRFMMKVLIDYPSEDEELSILLLKTGQQTHAGFGLDKLRALVKGQHILKLQKVAAELTIDKSVLAYITRIVRQTRDWPGISRGAGPRASIALMSAARAYALMHGQDYVSPDDVKAMCLPILRHRIELSAELELEGLSPDEVLGQVLDAVAAPRV